MAKDLAIVLNNGSINSAVITALAAQKHRPIMLYAEIGEQSRVRARTAYDQQVAHFKPYREHSMPMPYLTMIQQDGQGQMAVDQRQSGQVAAQGLNLMPVIAAALRFATHYQAVAVYVGMRVGSQADDLAQATEYIQIWNEMLQLPCQQSNIELFAPLLELEAWQVVDLGYQVSAPFERTWSCLEEGSEPCWACRGCRGRESAFQQAVKADPLRAVKRA